nr:retrovirus-related Pol polyprotein from transposon TNT 1-94 [Tanacetum cinerariifolium]
MSMTMLNEQSLTQKFWCNAVDTSTYILNRILIRTILGKTPYELLRSRKPTLDYFRVFGIMCFILNTKYYLTKSDPKSYECVFLGYSQDSKAYIILNKHTRKVELSLNVTFNETPPPSKTSPLVDDDLDEVEAIKVTQKKILENDIEDEALEIDEIVNIKESRNHPLENIVGNLNQRTLRSQAQNQNSKPMKTPMSLDMKLMKDEESFAFVHASKRIPKPLILKRLSVPFDTLKKQTALALSTIEAEYVSVRNACQKALWMKQDLIDYDIGLDNVPIICDKKRTKQANGEESLSTPKD